MKPSLYVVRAQPLDENTVVVSRWWRESRTLYQQHASWHEASRFDADHFESLTKFFSALRRNGDSAAARSRAA